MRVGDAGLMPNAFTSQHSPTTGGSFGNTSPLKPHKSRKAGAYSTPAPGTYNTKDETSAHRQINQTPLKFLLAEDPDLANGVKVLKIERVAESVLVTMQDRRNPNQGQLILVLDTQTLELRAWQVIDDKGERTTVRLESMAYGVPLPDALFQRPGF